MRPGSSQAAAAGSYTGRPQSAAGSINAAPTNHGRYSSKHLPYALVDFDKQQIFVNAVSGTPENPLWGGESTQYKFDVSRVTELQVSLYIRNPTASPNAGRSEDIFIGKLTINPRFEEIHTSEAKAKRETGTGHMGAEWAEVQFGSGNMKIGVNFVENRQERLAFEDFELLKVVGKGSFGKVFQVMYVSRVRLTTARNLADTPQEEGHSPYLRPQVDPQGTHHFPLRSGSHACGALGAGSN